MLYRLIQIVAVLLVIAYIAHNPHGTALSIKSLATGIGDFVTTLASR